MEPLYKKIGINSFVLKIIAVVSMTIDHVGAVIFPTYMWLRVIGRIAFPIYAFLIVEGYYHTGNIKKYLARLGIFAIISEPFFDYALFNNAFYIKSQNVFLTLFLGLLMICICEKEKYNKYSWLIMIGFGVLASLLCSDYGIFGIMMIYTFYVFRGQFLSQFIIMAVINGLFMNKWQTYAVLAMIPIGLYNGLPGKHRMKYFFYIYYPLHLAIIGIIGRIILK